jgi:hypothetical protein
VAGPNVGEKFKEKNKEIKVGTTTLKNSVSGKEFTNRLDL